MAVERHELTPQQRLAISRRALVHELRGSDAEIEEPSPSAMQRHTGIFDQVPWISMARRVTQRWWRRHPANAVGQLARPLLDRYAREQPVKLMAAAAAAGALIVLAKPWRLLSITAVLAAVLKTSDVADMVTTLMHKNPSPPRKDSE
jgi:hypothetical protein